MLSAALQSPVTDLQVPQEKWRKWQFQTRFLLGVQSKLVKKLSSHERVTKRIRCYLTMFTPKRLPQQHLLASESTSLGTEVHWPSSPRLLSHRAIKEVDDAIVHQEAEGGTLWMRVWYVHAYVCATTCAIMCRRIHADGV